MSSRRGPVEGERLRARRPGLYWSLFALDLVLWVAAIGVVVKSVERWNYWGALAFPVAAFPLFLMGRLFKRLEGRD
jgi:hypothetical protein